MLVAGLLSPVPLVARVCEPRTGNSTAHLVGTASPLPRSMNAAASITTEDGDKVSHGWSQLDIAKHSTNTFVSSLAADDYFCVVTYSDGANVRAPCPAHRHELGLGPLHLCANGTPLGALPGGASHPAPSPGGEGAER